MSATARDYHGRGFVQLTGKATTGTGKTGPGRPLVAQPDLVLETAIATRIIFDGMVIGTFTGKKLGDYFSPTAADWINARRIVNKLDKANNIAGYAQDFYAAISYTV